MASGTFIYKDIDLSFAMNPLTGDIAVKKDLNAINQSIYNLLMFKPYDEKFHPEINGAIRYYLFENFTPLTKISAENMIKTVLGNYEPRIKVTNVEVKDDIDRYALKITIYYIVLSTGQDNSYTFYAYRQR